DGLIAGGGALIKTGGGKFTVTAANTYLGGTAVTGGTLSVAADNNLGDVGGGVTLDGGAIQTTTGFTSARTFTVNAGNGTFDTLANSSALSNSIAGLGTLHKTGSGDRKSTRLNSSHVA